MSLYSHDINTDVKINKYNLVEIEEAYFGKTPVLLELESKIHDLREDLTETTSSASKKVLDINRTIEKQFGMSIFALKLLPSKIPDAYTYNIGNMDTALKGKKLRDYVIGDINNGYKFIKGNKICIVTAISYGIMNKNSGYTDAEILAILLHEIGHNFADCLYGELTDYNQAVIMAYKNALIQQAFLCAILSVVTFGLTLPTTIAAIKNLGSLNSKKKHNEEKRYQKKPKSEKIKTFLAKIKTNFIDKNDIASSVAYRLSSYGKAATKAYKNQFSDDDKKTIRDSMYRRSEVIADKFANFYGYGLELSSALVKMDKHSDNIFYKEARKKAKGNTYLLKLNDEYEEEMFDMCDYEEHPDVLQRVNSSIKTLKREYEKEDIDPRVKNELLDQINKLESLVNDITDKNKQIYKIDKAHAIYLAYLNETVPYGIDEKVEEEIDKILDKALK